MKKRAVRRSAVPYIVRWSGEKSTTKPVVRADGRGIGYTDERPEDRVEGVLWPRIDSRPGKGKPKLGVAHSLRQRNAMRERLCHICGKAADRNSDGILWLVDAHHHDLNTVELTAHPPVCLPCARMSVRLCPHLAEGWTALRVRSSTMYGVRGALFSPAEPAPVVTDLDTFSLDSPRLPWVQAGQLIAELRDFTVAEL